MDAPERKLSTIGSGQLRQYRDEEYTTMTQTEKSQYMTESRCYTNPSNLLVISLVLHGCSTCLPARYVVMHQNSASPDISLALTQVSFDAAPYPHPGRLVLLLFFLSGL